MSKRVKIAKLCLEIDGKKIDLTLKQAKELKEVLNETLGEETVRHVHHDRWVYPNHYPNQIPWYSTTTCGNLTETSTDVSAYSSMATNIADAGIAYNGDAFKGELTSNTLMLSTT
jgi:hypothetical protein